MFAWMNDEALKLTLDTGIAHYFSRSRGSLWKKGETSGQLQVVTELRIDCDQDAVLIKVRPKATGAPATWASARASTASGRTGRWSSARLRALLIAPACAVRVQAMASAFADLSWRSSR
jgi:hypothetical protein